MERTVYALSLFLVLLITGLSGAEETDTPTESGFDLYHVSITASKCRVNVLVNGTKNEFLSLNATNSSVVTGPLYREDLTAHNTVTLELDSCGEETYVTMSISGFIDEQKVVSTDDSGTIAQLDLDAATIAASSSKKFTVEFDAHFKKVKKKVKKAKSNIEKIYTEVSNDEVLKYAEYLLSIIYKMDIEKLAQEFVLFKPIIKRSLPDTTISEKKLLQKFKKILKDDFFADEYVKVKKADITLRRIDCERGIIHELCRETNQGILSRADGEGDSYLYVGKKNGKMLVIPEE